MISNGLPKDVSDLDFISYRNSATASTPMSEMLPQLPSVKISNYIFQNNGDISFTNKTKDWGWDIPTFSAGMAYADFDRDGDLDVVINNTNMEATLLENTLNETKENNHNFIRVQLRGDALNKNGLGTIIRLFYNGQQQYYDCTVYRGYMSSIENVAHFGVGAATVIDSIVAIWPNGKKQVLKNIATNQTINISIADADFKENYTSPSVANNNWFTNITNKTGINFISHEMDFIDFDIQKMLPHKLTQYGPSLAAGDVNGDGLDDLIVGGGSPTYARLFLQQPGGSFLNSKLIDSTKDFKYQDDGSICLFDADNDNDLDLYIASGGAENGPGYEAYADHFYINDGKGNFKENSLVMPANYTSKSCVKAADYDNDGDMDLFVGGRVFPGGYPKPVSSIILRNDTKGGQIKFTNVTNELAPALLHIGLVCDAVWSDADNDGYLDLIIAGEWMPITVLKNNKGKFAKIETSLLAEKGWWNSITAADIDNDGDMDYVA